MKHDTSLLFFILSGFRYDNVYDDTENKRASDSCDGYFADSHCHTSDTRNKDNGCGEEVSVLLEIYLLDHLKSRYGDKAVESDANAAHYAAGNGIEECYERRHEGDEHREDSSRCPA